VREQALVHAARVGKAPLGRGRERLVEQRRERFRRFVANELERRVLGGLHAAKRLEGGRRAKRVHAGEHFVEHGAEREEVAARVDPVAACLLRAHVRVLALELVGFRLFLAFAEHVARLGDAEVGDFDFALPRNQHVLRADVAVHDAERPHELVAAAVRVVEPLGDLGRDVHAHARREVHLLIAATREERREIEPRHVLHGDVVRGPALALDRSEVEHLHDVRVREAHRELRFVHEKIRELLRFGELRQDPLDDEDFFETLDTEALGLEDLGHAPATESAEKAVSTKCLVHDWLPWSCSLPTKKGWIERRTIAPLRGYCEAIPKPRAFGNSNEFSISHHSLQGCRRIAPMD
jgi:hypothetical protein